MIRRLVVFSCLALPAMAFTTGCPGPAASTDGGTGGTGGTSTGGTSGGSTSGASSSGGSSSGGTSGADAGVPSAICFFGAPADGGTGTSTDAGITGLGQSCNPNAKTDSCNPMGLVCQMNPSDPTGNTGTCQMPGEFQNCEVTVGCQPAGLKCTTITAIQKTPLCVYDCTTPADCPDVMTSCVTPQGGSPFCYYDICGPGSGAPAPNNGAYYASCGNATQNDGSCLPFQGASGPIGVCVAGGTVALGGACSMNRPADGGTPTPGLCAPGSFCVGNGDVGQCIADCNITPTTAVDGGPQCSPGSDYCLDIGGLNWGVCTEPCTAQTTCPSGLSCVSTGA